MYSWATISAGGSHSLALRSDGILYGWGYNNYGQLGLNDISNRSSPVQIGTSSWTSVSAGYDYSVGVLSNGKLFTWGFNTGYQLGLDDTVARSSPVQVTSTTESFTVVSAGLSHAFGVTNTYKLFGWGFNGFGQLGDSTSANNRSRPVQVGSTLSWSSVSAGGSHTVALTTDKKLYTWGRNDYGQTGIGITNSWVNRTSSAGSFFANGLLISDTNNNMFTVYAGATGSYGNNTSTVISSGSSPVQIGMGRQYRYMATIGPSTNIAFFGIDTNYRLWAWGDNISGQLGINYDSATVANQSSPVQIPGSWSVVANSMGSTGFAIDTLGRLFAWGENTVGQLGDNTSVTYRSSPVQVPGSWLAIASEVQGTVGIKSNGTLYAWSTGLRIPQGTAGTFSSPVQIGTSSYTQVVSFGSGGAALDILGRVWTWGQNSNGECGQNTNSPTSTYQSPVQISGSYTSIGSLQYSLFMFRTDGVWMGVGQNSSGQLGDGTNITRSSPVQVSYSFPTMVFGGTVVGGIKSDYTLWTWGNGANGGLGILSTTSRSSPVQVTTIQAQISPVQVGTSSWTSVAAGQSHSLGVTSDGSLFSWGANNNGQLGIVGSYKTLLQGIYYKYVLNSDNMLFTAGYNADGQLANLATVNQSNFVQASTIVQFSSVFASSHSGFAIDLNKNLWAWGNNNVGMLGNNGTSPVSSPVFVGGSWVNLVATSWADNLTNWAVTFGVTTDNKLFSWGQNYSGLRLIGNFLGSNSRSSPVQVGSDTNWDSMGGGSGQAMHITAKKTDGSIYGWGRNEYGQLGISNTVLISWTQLSGTRDNSYFGLRSDGSLWGWGRNDFGSLGLNDLVFRVSPVQLDTTNSYLQVAAGNYTAFFIRTDKTLWGTGYNNVGQLGDNTTVTKSSPIQVAGSWNSVDVGHSGHVAAVTNTGMLYTWGYGADYALGNGATTNRSSPIQISTSSFSLVRAGGSNYTLAQASDGTLWGWGRNVEGQLMATYQSWTGVYATLSHTAGLKSNSLFMWGNNPNGELGDGTVINRSSPVQIAAGSSVVSVSVGYSNTFFIDNLSRLWASGANTNGGVGDNTIVNRSNPVQITGSWTSVVAGNSTFAYKTDGTLWAWGLNTNGQLGDSSTVNRSSPVQITTAYTKIYAGGLASYSISSTGALFTWGNNGVGQLGDGTTLSRSSPVQLGTSSWSMVSAGLSHALAINIDSQLWGWGRNAEGQLGDGTSINRSNPVQITGSWTSVYTGAGGNTIGVKTDNTVWVWGYNISGQLALNDTLNRSSPVQLGVSFSNISVGGVHTTFAKNNYAYIVGSNANGQLGSALLSGTATSIPVLVGSSSVDSYIITPTQISSSSYAFISSGFNHNAVLTSNSNLYMWGDNTQGQLVGTPSPYSVTGTVNDTFIIRSDGKIYCAGINSGYQLNNGTTTARSTFSVTSTDVGRAISWKKLSSTAYDTTLHAIKSDGTLWGWGSNSFGQMGDNTVTTRISTVMIGTDSNWVDVIDGFQVTIGLKSDGSLWTWGANNFGTTGTGDAVGRSSPVQIGTSSYIQISSGGITAFAITKDYTLYAWGSGSNGSLGDNTTVTKSSPVQVPGSWSLVAGGYGYVVAQKTDGTLWTWGLNTYGLGEGSTYGRSSPVQINTTLSFAQLVPGGSFHMGITSDNYMYHWGDATFGQPTTTGAVFSYTAVASHNAAGYAIRDGVLYGTSQETGRLWPRTTNTASPVQLASNIRTAVGFFSPNGNNTLVFIKNDGTLWAGQGGAGGTVGDGTTLYRSSPVQIGTDTNWDSLSNGTRGYGFGAIKTNGTLYLWGVNSSGQLGDGTVVSRSSPVQVSGSWNVVSTGGNTTYAIDSNNKLWAWGLNTNGQLGQVLSGISWTMYSSGSNQCFFAIDETSALYAFGINLSGTLGTGDTLARTSYANIGTSSWSMVGAFGVNGTAGITVDGKLFTWGRGSEGQLGSNTTIDRSSPVQVGTSSWSFVSVGDSIMAAIDTNSRLFVWGYNSTGQLGQSDTVARSSPVQVAGSWNTVSVIKQTMAGIKSDGTLWTWGANSSGELGDGTTVNKSSPIQVGSSTNWTKVSFYGLFGTAQLAAINSAGQLYNWGYNNNGQLGDGTTVSKSSPVQLSGSWISIAGYDGNAAAIKSDYTLWTWGYASLNQYRLGFGINYSSPVQITAGTKVSFTQVAVNISNGIMVTPDQQIMVVGRDNSTYCTPVNTTWSSPVQLATLGGKALANTIHRSSPVQLGTQDWIDVKAGDSMVVALRADNTLWAWGANTYGNLANNTTINRSSPIQVYATTMSFVSLANTGYTVGVIDSRFALWTWGYNAAGYIGDGTTINKSSPVQIGLSSYAQVLSGSLNLFARDISNRLFGWGGNSTYTLLDGLVRSSPVQVGTNYDSVSVPVPKLVNTNKYVNVGLGWSHVVATRLDGTVDLWGSNTNGQLGDGTTTNRSSPVQVASLSWNFVSASPRQVRGSWSSVNAGYSNSMAIDATTSLLYGWGFNTYGQIGDLSLTSRSSPVQIGTSAYSVQFNSSPTQYLNIAGQNASYQINSGTSYTVEAWIYCTGVAATIYGIVGYNQIQSGTGYGGWMLSISGSNSLAFYTYSAGVGAATSILTPNSSITLNTWQHVALSYNGTTITLYIDGVSQATGSLSSVSYTYATLSIGRWNYGTPRYFPGYISNVRLVNGTAVYTSNFTPSTTQLTAIANTALLTCQSSTYIDTSATNATIVSYNSPPITTITPFTGVVSSTYDKVYNIASIQTNYVSQSNQLLGAGYGSQYGLPSGSNSSAYTNVGTLYNSTYYSPVLINSDSWQMVTTGASHTMAIKSDSTLWAWGYNLNGRLGDGTTISRSSPVQIGTSSWSQVVAAYAGTLGLTVDGKIYSWGINSFGALGTYPAVTRSSPVQIPTQNSINFITGAEYNFSAIDVNGRVYTWGYNQYGSLGIGSITNQYIPLEWYGTPVLVNRSSPVQVTGSSTASWSTVSAGNNISAAIDASSKLYTWGLNDIGQLGTGSLLGPSRSSPVQIGSKSFSLVSAGGRQMLGYSNTDTAYSPKSLYGWGSNSFGQLATNDTIARYAATQSILTTQLFSRVSTPTTGPATNPIGVSSPTQLGTSSWTTVSGGDYHTIGTTTSNVLFAWGLNNYGQLGDSTLINKSSPVQVTTNVVDVGAGGSHNVIEKSDGSAYTFGLNSDGQLGDNT